MLRFQDVIKGLSDDDKWAYVQKVITLRRTEHKRQLTENEKLALVIAMFEDKRKPG